MTRKATILIVDDEEVVRRLLKQKLSGEGYQCQEAGSADQALAQLRGNTVELVILDIKMPGKSGVEMLRLWRYGVCPREPNWFLCRLEMLSVR